MLAESVYKGVLDNGNFREFLHGAGGEFSTFKTGIPGGPAVYFQAAKSSTQTNSSDSDSDSDCLPT